MMTPEQEGAFIRLLCISWLARDVPCSLPNDDVALAQMSRLGSRRWKAVGGLVRAQFRPVEGDKTKLRNEKLWGVYQDSLEKHERRARSGKSGGEAKAKRQHSPTKPVALLDQSPSNNGSTGVANAYQPESEVTTPPARAREVGEALREKLSEPHNVAAVERFLSTAPTNQRAAALEAKLLTWLSGHDWPPGPKLTPNAAASGLAEYLDEPGDFSAAHVLAFLLRTVRQWHKHSEQLASGAAGVPASAQQEAQAIWVELKRSGVLYATTPREWEELAKAIAGTEVVKSVEHFTGIWRELDLPFLRAASTERAAVAHVAEALSRVQAAP